MKSLIAPLMNKIPYIKRLQQHIAEVSRERDELWDKLAELNKRIEDLREREGGFPAGHYYSPVPDREDVLAYLKARKARDKNPAGISVDRQGMLDLLEEYGRFYEDIPFPETQAEGFRYYFDNEWYSYGDAIFLHSFLRKHQPEHIIEVGSGFSSAVMLDTVDRFFPQRPEMTFIDPYPERLQGLLTDDDRKQVNVIAKKIQNVPVDLFASLKAGDLLFIDSSHVVKAGSDLQFLLFEILPLLPPGVFVHFHDMFWPFDYPSSWLEKGMYWNENYFLHAFLINNQEWSIQFFNSYTKHEFIGFVNEKMPLCAKNFGGGLYLRKEVCESAQSAKDC